MDDNISWKDGGKETQYEILNFVLDNLAKDAGNKNAIEFITQTKRELLSNDEYDPTVLISFGLGVVSMLGIALALNSTRFFDFGIFLFFQTTFHMMEYIYIYVHKPKKCSWHSFLLDHSKKFQYTMLAAMVEYTLEWIFFPTLKCNVYIVFPATLVCLLGQSIRTYAMHFAAKNFDHQIRYHRDPNHELVQDGPYTFLRHPAYFGWFWWAISTQFLLGNPICICLFSYASWHFFNHRIADEEETLIGFFGDNYKKYQAKTAVGIPFIL